MLIKKFEEIEPEKLSGNVFERIGRDWMLITAANSGKVNTMTASWGGFGVLFNKNVVFIFIRPQRFTREFVDGAETFSLTFFEDIFKNQLSYLGNVSGRDEDKLAKVNFNIQYNNDTPYIQEGNVVVICKKIYYQDLQSQGFISENLDQEVYPNGDYHRLFIGEIQKVLMKEYLVDM